MNQSLLLRKLEDERLRRHFRRVDTILRSRDVSHLPADLQAARAHYLDHLRAYAERGIFPRNTERPGYAPCFVDQAGRECAVAHLMLQSGQTELTAKIAAVANTAYVPDMPAAELDAWAAHTGLSKDELALIQPGYFESFTVTHLQILLSLWVAGLSTVVINLLQMRWKQRGVVMPLVSHVVGIALFLVGIYCLCNASLAYDVATHAETPDNLALLARNAVNPFLFGGWISLPMAFITSGISVYRTLRYQRLAQQSD